MKLFFFKTCFSNTGSGAMLQHFHGLEQDCSISIAFAMEILQSYTKPSIWGSRTGGLLIARLIIRWLNITWLNITWFNVTWLNLIGPSHKSHNASIPYPTMHHFVTEMCTCVHISVIKWCIVGYLHDALWDLWNGSITRPQWVNMKFDWKIWKITFEKFFIFPWISLNLLKYTVLCDLAA